MLLLPRRICGHYLTWQSPDSKQQWDSTKMLNTDSTPHRYNKLSLYFFTLEKMKMAITAFHLLLDLLKFCL